MLDALASDCWLVTADDSGVVFEAWVVVPSLLPVVVGTADAAPVGVLPAQPGRRTLFQYSYLDLGRLTA